MKIKKHLYGIFLILLSYIYLTQRDMHIIKYIYALATAIPMIIIGIKIKKNDKYKLIKYIGIGIFIVGFTYWIFTNQSYISLR